MTAAVAAIAGGESLDSWAGTLASRLGVPVDAVRSSLRWILSCPETVRPRAVARVAGNPDALAAGRPVLESTPADTTGWSMVQIISVESKYRPVFKTNRRERVCVLRVRPLTGPPAPDPVEQTVSAGLLRYVGRNIGFTRPTGNRPLLDDRELSGLKMIALFEPKDGRPRMVKYAGNHQTRKWNLEVLTARNRALPEADPCPRGLDAGVPCFRCTAGRSECWRAVRPRSLVVRPCAGCQTDHWFDPNASAAVCPTCDEAGKGVK